MPRKPKSEGAPLDKAKVLDPTQMSETELREYVAKLEKALASSTLKAKSAEEKPWLPGEKRWVMVPRTPTNDYIVLNGKARIGRCFVRKDEWDTILEIHAKAVRSELARMQTRGNMVAPHLLPQDDVSSRNQPRVIANL